MMPWDGAAIMRYLQTPKREAVAEGDRCVNEGDAGCAGRAKGNGWCGPCWATIVPPDPAPALSEPFDTGCGRR